jgi:hypothetical protein
VYRTSILGEDQLGRKEKAHIYVADVAQNDVGNYGPRLPGVGGDMPQQVRSGVGGELPHQKRKSGVGSNMPQQIGSVSKSDTRPDRGNLALSIAYSDVECYDVKNNYHWVRYWHHMVLLKRRVVLGQPVEVEIYLTHRW